MQNIVPSRVAFVGLGTMGFPMPAIFRQLDTS